MTPHAYMMTGFLCGLAFAVASVLLPTTAAVSVPCVFAAGALFGKGYGIWEERSRKKETRP